MARGRMLSKSLSTSAKRARLHEVVPDLAEFCQALYPLLVSHSDDHGRQAGDAFTVKHVIDPSSRRQLSEFDRALQALHDVDLIRWYAAGGRQVIQVQDFKPHQPGLTKPTPSKFPEFSGNSAEIPPELNRTELNRTERKKDVSAEPRRDSTPALTFPTVGHGSGGWGLDPAMVAEWQRLYPHLDVLRECRKALAWILANPGRRKTASGMPRFLVNWFNRETNNGHGSGTTHHSPGDRPITADERKRAEALRKAHGGCPHEQRCANSGQCIRWIVEHFREQEQVSA